MENIQVTSYKNSERFKYKNARVEIISLKDKGYVLKLKVFSEDTSQRTIHIVEKDKIVTTIMRISEEAAVSIMLGLQEQLKKDGIINQPHGTNI